MEASQERSRGLNASTVEEEEGPSATIDSAVPTEPFEVDYEQAGKPRDRLGDPAVWNADGKSYAPEQSEDVPTPMPVDDAAEPSAEALQRVVQETAALEKELARQEALAPSFSAASRIAARSTTAGTPVKSCIKTRAGR